MPRGKCVPSSRRWSLPLAGPSQRSRVINSGLQCAMSKAPKAGAPPASSCRLRCAMELFADRCCLPDPLGSALSLPRLQMAFPGGVTATIEYYEMVEDGTDASVPENGSKAGSTAPGEAEGVSGGDGLLSGDAEGTKGQPLRKASPAQRETPGSASKVSRGASASGKRGAGASGVSGAPGTAAAGFSHAQQQTPRLLSRSFVDVDFENPQALVQPFLVETMKLRFESGDGKDKGKAAAKGAPAPVEGTVASIDLAPLVVDLVAKQDFFLRSPTEDGLFLTGRFIVRLFSSTHELPPAQSVQRPQSSSTGTKRPESGGVSTAPGPRYQRLTTFLPRSLTEAGNNPFLFRIVSMSELPVTEDREWREAYLRPAKMTTTVLGIECASGDIPQGLFGGQTYGGADPRPRGTRFVLSDDVPIRVHCTYTCKGPEDCLQLRKALLEDTIKIVVKHRVPLVSGSASQKSGQPAPAKQGAKKGAAAASASESEAASLSDSLASVEFQAVAEVSLKSLAMGDRVYDSWVPLKPVFRSIVTGENLDLAKASELIRGRLPASLGAPCDSQGAGADAVAQTSFQAAQRDPATLPLGDWSRARIRVIAALAAPLPALDSGRARGSPLRSRPGTGGSGSGAGAPGARPTTAERESGDGPVGKEGKDSKLSKDARDGRDSKDHRDSQAQLVSAPRLSPDYQARRWFERVYFILNAADLVALKMIVKYVCTVNINFARANNSTLAPSFTPQRRSRPGSALGGAGRSLSGTASASTLPPLGVKPSGAELQGQKSASKGKEEREYVSHVYTDEEIAAYYSLLSQNTISTVFSDLAPSALSQLRPEHSLEVPAITGWAFWDPAFQVVFLEAPATFNLLGPIAGEVQAHLNSTGGSGAAGAVGTAGTVGAWDSKTARHDGQPTDSAGSLAALPAPGALDRLSSPAIKVGSNVRFRKRCAPAASLGLSRLSFVQNVGELAKHARSWTSEYASLEARRALETLLGLTVMSQREVAPKVDALGRCTERRFEAIYSPTPLNLRQLASAGLFLGDTELALLRNWIGGVLPGQLDIASVMAARASSAGRLSPRSSARYTRADARGDARGDTRGDAHGALLAPLSLTSVSREDGMAGIPDPERHLKVVLTDIRVLERKGALRKAREETADRLMEQARATARAARQNGPDEDSGSEVEGLERSPRGDYPRTLRPFWDSPEVWAATRKGLVEEDGVASSALAVHVHRASAQPGAGALAESVLEGTALLSKPESVARASRAVEGAEVYLYSTQTLGAARLTDLSRSAAQSGSRGFVYARDCYRRPTLDTFQPEYSARGTPEYQREKGFNKTPNLKTDGWRKDPRLQVHPARADQVREEWDEQAIALLNSEGRARAPDYLDDKLRGKEPFRLRVAPKTYLDEHPENMLGIIHADEEYEEALRKKEKAEWKAKMVVDRPYLQLPHATPIGKDGRAANGGIVEPLLQADITGDGARQLKYSIRAANRRPVVTTRTPSLASQEPYPEAQTRTFDAMLAASKPARLAPLEERHPEVLQRMVEIADSSVLRYEMREDEENDPEESKRAKRKALRDSATLRLERYTKSLPPSVYSGCDIKAACERVQAVIRTNGDGLEELKEISGVALERQSAREILQAGSLPSARAKAQAQAQAARRGHARRGLGMSGDAGATEAHGAVRASGGSRGSTVGGAAGSSRGSRISQASGAAGAPGAPGVAQSSEPTELEAARSKVVHPMSRTTMSGAPSYSAYTSGTAARLLDRTVSIEGDALKY